MKNYLKETSLLGMISFLLVTPLFTALEIHEEKAPVEKINVPKPEDKMQTKKVIKDKSTIDEIYFFNKDRVKGKFLSSDDSKTIKWRHPDVDQTILFNNKNIKLVKLSGAEERITTGKMSKIFLTNDDELLGTIVGMNEDTLTLQTWYADVLKIERPMIKHIVPNANSK